jgi:DNA-binding CsgD family transcriptional regulator
VSSIYTKLDVSTRSEAVESIEQLGLRLAAVKRPAHR